MDRVKPSLLSACLPMGKRSKLANRRSRETRRASHVVLDHTLGRHPYYRYKYAIERAIGCCLLVIASPLILILGLVIKATSKGPALYRQERMGFKGSTFEIIKLRTMRLDAEADGVARWCAKRDPRITPFGRFLRKTHLDELPQLVNVARGEMVLVGPRPERPVICERLARRINGYYDRLAVKPGITGLAQINLPPDQSDEDVRRKQVLDLHYIHQANLWLDLRMLAVTGARILGLNGGVVMRATRLCRLSLLDDALAMAELSPNARVDDGEAAALVPLGHNGRRSSGRGRGFQDQSANPRHPR